MINTKNLMAIVCGVILAMVFAAVFFLNAYVLPKPVASTPDYSQVE